MDLQLTPGLGLQLSDGGCDVSGQDGGARPPRIGERGRCHVLRPGVQRPQDGLPARDILFGQDPPRVGKQRISPPAEQERVGALVSLVDERDGLVVALPPRPSAALEAVPAVLI